MTECDLATEELFLILYCIVDDLYHEAAPDWVRFRTGADRMGTTDAEIITLSIMQEGQSNDSELSFHQVVKKNYLHLFPDLICRSRYHRRRKDLMGIQREMLRLLMNRLRLLAMWLAPDSAPITTAESPRWKSAQMSIWAAEAGFSPSKQQFFLGFRLHLLASGKGAICDFVLSPANVGERRVAEHLLAVEAKWQALQSAFFAEARPVLAVGGLLRRLARGPLREKRRSALVCTAAKQGGQIRKRGSPSRLPSRPAGSDRRRLLVARRSVPNRRDTGTVRLGRNDARSFEAALLHGRLCDQRGARSTRNGPEEPLPVMSTYRAQ